MKSLFYLLAIYLFAMLVGCESRQSQSPQLTRIYELSESDPGAALAALDSVNPAALSTPDRHYYDFLTIKVHDKNDMRPASDSLYLSVYDYYQSDMAMLPEALYYGGRVYSELGDYPTALKYYQNALDATPSKEEWQKLKGKIYAQTAHLLVTLRLYEEALPYLYKTVSIDSLIETPYILAYDLHLLGRTLLGLNQDSLAEIPLRSAQQILSSISTEDEANMEIGIATVHLRQGHIDSALCVIRHAINNTTPEFRNVALMTGTNVYRKAEILDSAYLCALSLAHSKDSLNRRWGYRYLLYPELLPYSSSDSIAAYACEYGNLMEGYINTHDDQQALIQQSLYNYQSHERKRLQAEREKQRITQWTSLSIILVLLLVAATLYFRNRSHNHLLQLHKTLNDLTTLKEHLATSGTNAPEKNQERLPDPADNEIQKLRRQIQQQLLDLLEQGKGRSTDARIIQSKEYHILREYIDQGKSIGYNDSFWGTLEEIVLRVCPNLKQNLRLLMGREAKPAEMQTVLLIKCGVTPTQMSQLLNLAKGSISNRRRDLGIKILDQHLPNPEIDKILRLL